MAFDLTPFEQWAVHRTIDLTGVVLRAQVVAVWEKADTTVSGTLCDHYRPGVAQVDLLRDDRVLATLSPSITDPGAEAAFASLRQAIEDEGQIPYLFDRLVVKGSPVPEARAPHTIAWHRLSERVKAHDDLMASLLRRDPAASAAAAFRRFQQSDEFLAQPCDSVFYAGMRREFLDGPYTTGMGFGDYYAWFHRSAQYLDGNGGLTPEATATATHLLTAWSAKTQENALYWLNRNMEVHPRHEPTFDTFAGRFREGQTLREVTPTTTETPRRPAP